MAIYGSKPAIRFEDCEYDARDEEECLSHDDKPLDLCELLIDLWKLVISIAHRARVK